jgi:hypothetical protein
MTLLHVATESDYSTSHPIRSVQANVMSSTTRWDHPSIANAGIELLASKERCGDLPPVLDERTHGSKHRAYVAVTKPTASDRMS